MFWIFSLFPFLLTFDKSILIFLARFHHLYIQFCICRVVISNSISICGRRFSSCGRRRRCDSGHRISGKMAKRGYKLRILLNFRGLICFVCAVCVFELGMCTWLSWILGFGINVMCARVSILVLVIWVDSVVVILFLFFIFCGKMIYFLGLMFVKLVRSIGELANRSCYMAFSESTSVGI